MCNWYATGGNVGLPAQHKLLLVGDLVAIIPAEVLNILSSLYISSDFWLSYLMHQFNMVSDQ